MKASPRFPPTVSPLPRSDGQPPERTVRPRWPYNNLKIIPKGVEVTDQPPLRKAIETAVEELMERLTAYARDWRGSEKKARASVRRKFERDKDELRGLGIPLETVTYSINYSAEEAHGYRIAQSDFYLPLSLETGCSFQTTL